MENLLLYEKFQLIERSESEINGAWKGAHLLLFFLSFVFGSFCTFCFHMLMYLFDEQCVLYPKLLSLTTLRQNIIYEFLPYDKEEVDMLPVDFVSTQWVEKSVCYLPTYVPLVSGISGLVWTTMFLMCSAGSRVFTGLQKSWRILPSVFIFSLVMGSLCVYSSGVTHHGLHELCQKLSEITGNPSCTFTVNIATLAYERRIRGVYQAVKLTIVTAWLHTCCWVLSVLLTVARVVLAVDFQLIRVSAHMKGNIDRVLEHQEHQVGTVFPEYTVHSGSSSSIKLRSKVISNITPAKDDSEIRQINSNGDELLNLSDKYYQSRPPYRSSVPNERYRLERQLAYRTVSKKHKFIVKLLFDMIDKITLPEPLTKSQGLSATPYLGSEPISKQFGESNTSLKVNTKHSKVDSKVGVNLKETEAICIKENVSDDTTCIDNTKDLKYTSTLTEEIIYFKSTRNKQENNKKIKSNLKQSLTQPEERNQKVQTDFGRSVLPLTSQKSNLEKEKINTETQTHKEKQE